MDKNYAIYSYGITGFSLCINKETNQLEKDLLIMTYGNNKYYVFEKDKAFELICAICGTKNSNGSTFSREYFESELDKMGLLQLLESKLTGRSMIMITKYRHLSEYTNGLQNAVVGITGLNLDGKPIAHTKNELFKNGFADGRIVDYSTIEDIEKKEAEKYKHRLDKDEHYYDA